jgi:formate hydrogenlyase subunit 3/multisubunit Na+/H+ antiporter MnhD subunit
MPVPVIVLLSIVALFVYAIIGAVVTPLILGWWMDDRKVRSFLRGHGDVDMEFSYALGIPAWPIMVAAAACVCVFYGPYWVARKVAFYVGRHQKGIEA